MKKEMFLEPELEVVCVDADDVVRTSAQGGGEDWVPDQPLT